MAKKIIPDANASPDWRAQVGVLVKRALDVLRDEDEDIQMLTGFNQENGPFAWTLISDARRLLEGNADMLRTDIAGDYYGDVIVPALAMVLGAQGMKHTHRALPAMLEPAVAALREAEEIAPSCPAEDSSSLSTTDVAIAPPAASSKAASVEGWAQRVLPSAVQLNPNAGALGLLSWGIVQIEQAEKIMTMMMSSGESDLVWQPGEVVGPLRMLVEQGLVALEGAADKLEAARGPATV